MKLPVVSVIVFCACLKLGQSCSVGAECECDDQIACDCTYRTSSLKDNKDMFCKVGPKFLGGFVFRGVHESVIEDDMSDEKREDQFTIVQKFKGSEPYGQYSIITVEYSRITGCPDNPYDQDGLSLLIFGSLDNDKVKILNCTQVVVYNCMQDQDTFNGYSTNDPCNPAPFGF